MNTRSTERDERVHFRTSPRPLKDSPHFVVITKLLNQDMTLFPLNGFILGYRTYLDITYVLNALFYTMRLH